MKPLVVTLGAIVAAAALAAGAGAGSTTATAATITVRSSSFGPVLFDGRGKVLYAFTKDTRGGKSRCYGACATAWPVYYASGKLTAGKGVKQSLIGTTRRSGGRLQVTYNGWPLYYYIDDPVGEIRCQNVNEFGGLWLIVRASGRLVR
jgi:predicted lipoprotein with Yx(FWY)xxD motif